MRLFTTLLFLSLLAPLQSAAQAPAGGKFLPQTGAALIKDKDGTIIGSAGASGGTGDEDEACCVTGIEAAGLTADASA